MSDAQNSALTGKVQGRLTFACGLYDRMQPLYTGEVRPDGIDIDFKVIEAPREIFDRMAATQEFDLAEMSISEYATRLDAGQCPFVALPVFPSRAFRHSFITVDRRKIRTPGDLAGKRIGVPLYTMTAAVWIRGALEEDFGVDLSNVTWVQGSINGDASHGSPTVMPMHRDVPIEINRSGRSLSALLDEGLIDAIIGTTLPACRATNPDVDRLFLNFREVEQSYYQRTGIFPIMHIVAMRKDVHERHPAAAAGLYAAFCKARRIALTRMKNLAALRYMLPWLPESLDQIEEVFGGDPWPYGVDRNRATLEALLRHLFDQGLLSRRMGVDELFLPVAEGIDGMY
jgi:4,5-dihydroxyphthalate decarboxylase